MNINVQKLRDAIGAAIAEHAARHAREIERNAEWEAARLDTWRAEFHDDWITAVRVITAKLQAEQPVLSEDIPRGGTYHDAAFYSVNPHRNSGDPKRPSVYRADPELIMLLEALKLVTDETVTPNSLSSIGITGAKIRHVLAYLSHDDHQDQV